MTNFCTLFDSKYLPYGLALYESLKKHSDSFQLYIVAFDQKCFDILKKLDLPNVTPISLDEFEDEELIKVKSSRTRGEYCWTCTPSVIRYCIDKYSLDCCTYLDSDIFFYDSPNIILDEMGDKSVLITEHRFAPEYEEYSVGGKYCVQYVTFKNDKNGKTVLEWWRNACLEWCYHRLEDGKFGDQKYLDDWTERFDGVHVMENLGGGIAPWNVSQYEIFNDNGKLFGKELSSGNIFSAIFYHFHRVRPDKKNNLKLSDGYECAPDLFYQEYFIKIVQNSIKLNKIDDTMSIYTFNKV